MIFVFFEGVQKRLLSKATLMNKLLDIDCFSDCACTIHKRSMGKIHFNLYIFEAFLKMSPCLNENIDCTWMKSVKPWFVLKTICVKGTKGLTFYIKQEYCIGFNKHNASV